MNEEQHLTKSDLSFSFAQAALVAIALIPFVAAVCLLPYLLIWGSTSLLHDNSAMLHPLILVPLTFVGIIAHELLHGLGYVIFGRLRWSVVRFGLKLKSLTAYAYTDSHVTAASHKRLVALPAFILGIIPVCVGTASGVGWLTLYGFLMLIGTGGDMAILWKLRNVHPNAHVLDNPDRAGCWVFSQQPCDRKRTT